MTGSELPLVSIIIPTHNRLELLIRALGSALAQTYPRIELLVVDDGSTDGTKEHLSQREVQKQDFRYLRNDVPQGPCAARNRGIEAATGEYVTFLDDDDAFHPERTSKLMETLSARPGLSFACSDFLSIRRNGIRRSRKPGLIDLEKILWFNYATQSVLVARDKVLAMNGFDESLTAAQDYDLFTRLIEAYGPAYRLGEALYYYHQDHEGARITGTPRKRIRGYYDYYLKHKDSMSRRQRSWHLYRLLKLRGRSISPGRFLGMVPPRYYLLELNDYFIHHTALYSWLNSFKKALRI